VDQSIFTQLAIVGLFASMLGMGMTLRPADFLRVISQPAAVAVGLATQMIGLPLVAVALVLVFSLDKISAMALIALAACPGGASSNSLSFFAKGDVPLSITLTATNSLISFMTTPLVIAWGLLLVGATGVDVELPFWDTARQILVLVVLPVLGGMAVAWKLPRLAAGAARPLVYLGLALIVLPTLLLPLRGTGISADRFVYFALITGALNVAGMLLALAIGAAARLTWKQRRTLMIECGIQNFGLYIVISSVFFRSVEMLEAGVPYLFWMLLTSLCVVFLQRRVDRNRNSSLHQAAE
jgi:BASS family bile acid:Na+ symporter